MVTPKAPTAASFRADERVKNPAGAKGDMVTAVYQARSPRGPQEE
jgi:hypothetical protein